VATDIRQATGWYVYAVCEPGDLKLTGLESVDGGHPLETISGDGVSVIVSEVRLAALQGLEEEAPTEDGRLAQMARRHDAVVEAAFSQGTLLPLRLGTVLRDRKAVAQLLSGAGPYFRDELQRLRGCREWQVKVLREHQSERSSEEGRNFGSGTAYLAARAAAQKERDETATKLNVALERLDAGAATAADASEPIRWLTQGTLYAAAFLVPGQQEAAFQDAVEQGGAGLRELGVGVELRGPFPPYHFVDAKLGGGPQ